MFLKYWILQDNKILRILTFEEMLYGLAIYLQLAFNCYYLIFQYVKQNIG
jgi:hypothetical protein